jgi:hypothetical protein
MGPRLQSKLGCEIRPVSKFKVITTMPKGAANQYLKTFEGSRSPVSKSVFLWTVVFTFKECVSMNSGVYILTTEHHM